MSAILVHPLAIADNIYIGQTQSFTYYQHDEDKLSSVTRPGENQIFILTILALGRFID